MRLFTRGMLLEAAFNPRGGQRAAVRWILGAETAAPIDEPFNANPVLAGYVLGNIIREPGLEARRRGALAAALSAVGDRLVWGLLRPLAVVASLLAAAAGPIPAGIVLLLVYNPPELALRWRAIGRGLEGSAAVLQDLSGEGLPRLAARIARLGAAATGCLGGYWLVGTILAGAIIETIGLLAGLVTAWLLVRAVRPGIWGLPLAALLFALLWIVVAQIVSIGRTP